MLKALGLWDASTSASRAFRLRTQLLQRHNTNKLSYLLFSPELVRHRVAHRWISLARPITPARQISFFSIPKFGLRVVKLGAAIGGGLAAGGSYVIYKIEEASNYTSDQMKKAKELAENGASWLSLTFGSGFWSSKDQKSGSEENELKEPKEPKTPEVVAAVAGGAVLEEERERRNRDHELVEEDEEEEDESTEDQMLNLTKKMIEIRNLLARVDQNDSLRLPSIVVVGSQSSGKSSVLEAVVGKRFLPKGDNMVTRRPIELTLINDPEAAIETAEFSDLKMKELTNFDDVSKILMELNLTIPSTEAVSNDPIRLTIRSPRAPDLTLVDLPGYIQVQSEDQPKELKQKIRDLCMKYLEPPNIILAISPADVDLANLSALRAAQLVDPNGERTLGVITKMDLVSPQRGSELLRNNRYPLKMGYVGVISKPPAPSAALFLKKRPENLTKQLQTHENDYFYSQENERYFFNTTVGTKLLKKKLMKTLEKSMSASLQPTHQAIQHELEDASYKFKVEFNDRPLTPETYLASNLDLVKVGVKELSAKFGRAELRSLLQSELDQRVLDLLALRYWNKPLALDGSPPSSYSEPILQDLANASENDLYWHRKLDLTTSSLTKLGVGRLSTSLVTNALLDEIHGIILNTNLAKHPLAQEIVMGSAKAVLNSKYYQTADQVENCIKPFKYEIDLEDREWKVAREHTVSLLSEEIRQSAKAYKALRDEVGSRKLKNVVSFIERYLATNAAQAAPQEETLQFSKILVEKGREAMFLQDRLLLLHLRLAAIKSSGCATKENKYKCPEVFLTSVVDKLTLTAVLFLNVELLSDFFYNFPRDLDTKLSASHLGLETVEAIAKEDPKVKRHIELQQRKELLEEAMTKIEHIIALKNTGVVFK